jgi:hypothetical protein
MEQVRTIAARSGMVLSCVMPGMEEPSNNGMKLTKPSVLELRSLSWCSTDVKARTG